MDFDLAMVGGDIIDPVSGTIERADIALNDGRIAAIGQSISADRASSTYDLTGRFVTPGLVDLHTHVNWRTYPIAIDVNSYAPTSGATTWVDAGSAYGTTIEALIENAIASSDVRVLAFLRLEHPIPGVVDTANHAWSDPAILAAAAKKYSDHVVGVKVAMGQCEIRSLYLALEAAELAGLPLMVHIAQMPPDVREILPLLRPGDIVTHAFTGQAMRLLEPDGRVLEQAREARDRGVYFDIGHGAGSFSWDSAEHLLEEGFAPDTISTDIWQVSARGPMFDLPTCMSKFLHLGMPLLEVVRAATTAPARAVGRCEDFGTLKVGTQADITVLRIQSGEFPLYDTHQEVRVAERLMRAEKTFVAGRLLPTRKPPNMSTWLEYALTNDGHDPNPEGGIRPAVREFQVELERRGHTPTQMLALT